MACITVAISVKMQTWVIQSKNPFLGWVGLRVKCPRLRKPNLGIFLQPSMRIVLLSIGLLNRLQTKVPKHSFQFGDLYFDLHEPFEDPRDTLVQQWLKYLIEASSFVNSVMEIVRITCSVKLKAFL